MHGVEFLQDLAVVMTVAGMVTVLFHRFKQPVVLGYILAGVIIGPHTPPFPLVQDEGTIRTLSELGVILLMFALGMEFSLQKIRKVGPSALLAALLEILLMVWIGYEIGRAFGWSNMDSIFLGAILSISSTTIIVKALHELGKTKEKFAQLIFGILVIEDLLGIAMIALLSGLAATGQLSAGDVGITLAKLAVFLAVSLVVGLLAVPRLTSYVAQFKSGEMLLITALGLCFGFALLAAKLGYSVALGAFLIGAVVAETREIHRIEALTEPVRDMFSAIFFVAIGLLIDPRVIAEHWLPIVVITIAVVAGKVLACAFGAFAGGNDTRTSLRVGMGLAQIGEFSFIIASLGLTLKVTSDFLYPITVAVSALTTLLTPYLIKSADGLVNWFDRTAPQRLVNSLDLYTEWVAQSRAGRQPGLARRLIRRWSWQMALNLALASGVFIAASFIGRRRPAWFELLPGGDEWAKAILWFGAVLLTLPLFVATYRKLQALGLLLSELAQRHLPKLPGPEGKSRETAIQAIIGSAVPLIGAIGMGLLVLVLSSAILPSAKVLLVLLLVAALLTFLFWRSMVRAYSKAQIALEETFAAQPEPDPRHATAPVVPAMPAMLKNACIEVVVITPQSPALRKMIRELGIRTRTGATIVAIERAGQSLVSPGPDDELESGDQLMIVGSASQVAAARAFFAGS